MIGLTGTRVLVIDDSKEDALPVLMAFAKRGIPTVYFDGRLGKLPSRRDRLVGVRLAVLDMHLGEGGDANSVASALVKRIELILHPSNGPYAVLIWTNHEEYRAAFERYIFSSDDAPRPIFTAMITKASCRNKRGAIVLKRVSEQLSREIEEVGPLEFMEAWEGSCFEAATRVSNSVAAIAGGPGADLAQWRREWKSQTLRALRAMASAKAEQQLREENCVESIFDLLNPLHADAMGKMIPRFLRSAGRHSREIMQEAGQCSENRKAEINTMLHIALTEVRGFAPGNIYVFRRNQKLGWPNGFSEFVSSFVKSAPDHLEERTREVVASSHPLIAEISAVCDFAQNKLPAARFLCGFLAPPTTWGRLKGEGAFKKIGPVMFESARIPRDRYSLYFSSRQVLSLPLSKARNLKPDARLRGQALTELQSWFSFQAGRQGIVAVS